MTQEKLSLVLYHDQLVLGSRNIPVVTRAQLHGCLLRGEWPPLHLDSYISFLYDVYIFSCDAKFKPKCYRGPLREHLWKQQYLMGKVYCKISEFCPFDRYDGYLGSTIITSTFQWGLGYINAKLFKCSYF